jgi:predicted DCC family thiol-disulfide oxidoreductase YuxK
MDKQDKHIILYDGICNLCNGFVRFIRKRDRKSVFEFIPLQSDEGREYLSSHSLPEDKLDTVIYIENGDMFMKSSAGLRILRLLGWPWKVLYLFIILPVPVRDFLYDIIALSRYRIFGKSHSCEIPSAQDK